MKKLNKDDVRLSLALALASTACFLPAFIVVGLIFGVKFIRKRSDSLQFLEFLL